MSFQTGAARAGRIVRSATFGDVRAAEVRYPGDRDERMHRHARAHLVLTLDGAVRAESSEEVVVCTSRMLRLVYPDALHRNRYDGGHVTNWLLEIDDRAFAPLVRHLPAPPSGVRCFAADAAPAALAQRMYDEFARRHAAWELALEGLLLELWVAVVRSTATRPAAPAWLAEARTLIRESATLRIPARTIARQVGVHPVHLSRAFRAHFGTTIGAYRRMLRLELARDALRTSSASLSDVALTAGFCDQSRFTAVFRRAFGTTPARFRQSLRA